MKPILLLHVFVGVLLLTAGCASVDSAIQAPRRQRAEAYIQSHPELSQTKKQAIRTRSIVSGMTEAEVIVAIGQPTRRNLTGGDYGGLDQWVYHFGYLYFEGGVLKQWQMLNQ